MAWMRVMGLESVDYHRETVIDRADDHPGAALSYYASRGETPLVWGGLGARDLGWRVRSAQRNMTRCSAPAEHGTLRTERL